MEQNGPLALTPLSAAEDVTCRSSLFARQPMDHASRGLHPSVALQGQHAWFHAEIRVSIMLHEH